MNLYIETENGQTKNHPAFEDNLLDAFGSIPAHWEPFVRVLRPTLSTYQILQNENPTYEKVDGVWTDVWNVRNMTLEEMTAKQQASKDAWATQDQAENYSGWLFVEATCRYAPPIPYPNDGKEYFWQGTTSSWIEMPQYPTDEKQYKLDYASASWVEITP